MNTGLGAVFYDAWPHALPGQLEQAEIANSSKLDTGAVSFNSLFEAPFNAALISGNIHINKVDND